MSRVLRAISQVTATAMIGAALTVTATSVAAAAPAPPRDTETYERPDLVAAKIAARSLGKPVEVTDLRTETTSVFANPDGTMRSDIAAGPIRVRQGDDWADLDLSLQQRDGRLRPVASPTDVSLSAGGDAPLAEVRDGGRTARMTWPGSLPAPVVEGGVARYADVLPNADLEMSMTSEGFEQHVVLRKRPGAAPVLRLGLDLDGLAAEQRPNGEILLKDPGTGKVVGISPAPEMWGAEVDARKGEPKRSARMASRLVHKGGRYELEVTPSAAFLADPDVTYPVTLDPAISLTNNGDTWVQNDYSSSQITDAWLKIGTYDAGAHAARSLIKWTLTGITGKHVTAATLSLYTHWSYQCGAATMNVYPVVSPGFTSSTVWTSQPPVTTSYGASASFAAGYEPGGCGDAVGSINVASMVNAWAAGSLANYGMRLQASETASSGWKKFCSANVSTASADAPCSSSTRVPKLSVTYNSYPSAPSTITPSNNSYVPAGTKLSAKVTDADAGSSLKIQAVVQDNTTGGCAPGTASGCVYTGSSVASGSYSTYTLPSSLVNGRTYRWRVRTYDGTDYSGYLPSSTGWYYFTYDNSAPVAPTVTSTAFPSASWPASGTSGTFSWTTTSTDVTGYYYGLDTPTPGTWTTGTTSSSYTPSNGAHTMYVRAKDRAGNLSAITQYKFGVGSASLTSPQDQDKTTGTVTLTGSAQPGMTGVRFKYRRGTTGTFVDVPTAHITNTVVSAWPVATTNTTSASSSPTLVWDVAATLGTDDLFQVQVCFSSATPGESCSTSPPSVQLDRLGNGDDFASESAGPGEVSLATGNLEIAAADASLKSFRSTVGATRTFNSLDPDAPSPFGPGWGTTLPVLGTSALQGLSDRGSYVIVTRGDGSEAAFTLSGTTYVPQNTAENEFTVTAQGSDFVVTAANGATTTLSPVTTYSGAATPTSPHEFSVRKVVEPGSARATGYTYVNGKLTQVLAPNPTLAANVATESVCTSPASVSTWPVGCRGLLVTYDTTTGKIVSLTTVTTSGAGTTGDPYVLNSEVVAQYTYTSDGRLATYRDPRIVPNLVTSYAYDSLGRIVSLTPPGEAPWTFTYVSGGSENGRLRSVTRANLDGTQPSTTTFVYKVPVASPAGPIPLDAATVANWGQTSVPVEGTAVFPADHVPSIPPTDYTYASLAYMDAAGREVNSAVYSGGEWAISTTDYDQSGQVSSTLSAANRAVALDSATPSATADELRQRTLYDAAGNTTDTYGPYMEFTRPDGTTTFGREHTHNVYDEGKPDTTVYNLVTTRTVSLSAGSAIPGSAELDARTTSFQYAIGTDTSGWALKTPLREVTDPAGLALTKTTLLNTDSTKYAGDALTIETRMPSEPNGGGAGSRRNVYYTVGTNSEDSRCGNQPQWANMLCLTKPVAQPGTSGLPALRETLVTYDHRFAVRTSTETAGTDTRTTTVSYDAAGRAYLTAVASTAGTSVPDVTTTFATSTGRPISTSGGTDSVSRTFDSKGRLATYTDAAGATTTFTYDVEDRITAANTPVNDYAYTYGSDTERTGALTDVTVGSIGTFSLTYDASGNADTYTFPNGVVGVRSYDPSGHLESIVYRGSDGVDWLSYVMGQTVHGQQVTQQWPGSDRNLAYDAGGRLVKVEDIVAGACTVREYGFAGTAGANSNRTSLTTTDPDETGACLSGTAATATWTYDSADRMTGSGATYDAFGRITTMPATGGQPELTSTYRADDLVATQAAASQTASWQYDPLRRTLRQTEPDGVTVDRHYMTDDGPISWDSDSTGSTWSQNLLGPDGKLAGVAGSDGSVQLFLVDPHGDVAATMSTTSGTTGPDATYEYTEFGTPRDGSPGTYGWLGGHAKPTEGLAGTISLGVRTYQPASGRFLQTDPVDGGGDNAYDYARQDPANRVDLDGRYSMKSNCGMWTCTFYFSRDLTRWAGGLLDRWAYFGAAVVAAGMAAIFTALCAYLNVGSVICGIFGMIVGAYVADVIRHAAHNNKCFAVKVYIYALLPYKFVERSGKYCKNT